MNIKLIKASENDLNLILEIQKESFKNLLQKYEDYNTNPAAENIDQIKERFEQSNSFYYLIYLDNVIAGFFRFVADDTNNEIFTSPICILPEYQKQGIAKYCMIEIENINNNCKLFKIATILQEKHLCNFYKKLGYKEAGERINIKENMDIIFYEKVLLNR